jgi:two-component system, NarL family, invasion response regulator UvrY
MRILVADDHAIMRDGLINSLSRSFPDADFGEAGTSPDILSMIRDEKWDLVILDINIPGRNGLEVLKDIKEQIPDLPVIILSMYPEDQFAIRTIKAGASAYLTKDTSVPELVKAIKTILEKKQYITSSVASLLTSEVRSNLSKPLHETLSDREFQVFKLISSGKTISIIAEELSLSVKTISVYRANILQKMNLKNNAEITNYAFRNNLAE